jgi:hypothetical protein
MVMIIFYDNSWSMVIIIIMELLDMIIIINIAFSKE